MSHSTMARKPEGMTRLPSSRQRRAERLRISQNSVGSVPEFVRRSCGKNDVPDVGSPGKAAFCRHQCQETPAPEHRGRRPAVDGRDAEGAYRGQDLGAAWKYIASLAIYGALRADLDPRYHGSRSASNVAQTRDMGVGFFGLASHWKRCTYDSTSGTRWAGATRASPWPPRRLVAPSSGTKRQPLPSP